jgi:hypothetical protein
MHLTAYSSGNISWNSSDARQFDRIISSIEVSTIIKLEISYNLITRFFYINDYLTRICVHQITQ